MPHGILGEIVIELAMRRGTKLVQIRELQGRATRAAYFG